MQKVVIFKLCAARDSTVVDEGLHFTTSKNLPDKYKCSSENIANLASLTISHCSSSKLWLTKASNQSAVHGVSSQVILSIKNEGALYIDCQFTAEDSAALKAQRVDFAC